MSDDKATESGMKHIARALIVVALLAFIGTGLTLHWPDKTISAATLGLVFVLLGLFF